MGGFIAKQPNGLYCRFSSVVDCPTDYNMTAEDYAAMCAKRAEAEAYDTLRNHLYPFEDVIASFVPNNMTRKEFNAMLKKMGYVKGAKE